VTVLANFALGILLLLLCVFLMTLQPQRDSCSLLGCLAIHQHESATGFKKGKRTRRISEHKTPLEDGQICAKCCYVQYVVWKTPQEGAGITLGLEGHEEHT